MTRVLKRNMLINYVRYDNRITLSHRFDSSSKNRYEPRGNFQKNEREKHSIRLRREAFRDAIDKNLGTIDPT